MAKIKIKKEAIMGNKICRKCGKKEFGSGWPFMSPYGLCNECFQDFLPFIHKALMRFLKTRKGSGKKSWVTRRKHLHE